MLKGFVLTTLNKLPQVKPDLVRTDDPWEDWGMEDLLKALQKWLNRNKGDDSERKVEEKKDRRERNWYEREEDTDTKEKRKVKLHCAYCEKDHWGEACNLFDTLCKLKQFFVEKRLWSF